MFNSTFRMKNSSAMIDHNVLLAYGAGYKKYKSGEVIFEEGSNCLFYHQVVSGRVKWLNLNDEGKEYIQNIVDPGESFGEIPLFDDGLYVATSVAIENTVVLRLPKKVFLQLLIENPEINLQFSKLITKRLRYKFVLLKTNAFENPEKRITVLLNFLKQEKHIPSGQAYQVELTRQEIANMTGLRVETVIRTIRDLFKRRELTIDHGKIYY